jgi:hypothetical protein
LKALCLVSCSRQVGGVLVKFFLELRPNRPAKNAIKWGLITGTFYVSVFWLNNTTNWIAAIVEKGTDYVLLYPANLFSFLLTTVGLLLLGLYAMFFSRKSFGAKSLAEINIRTLGIIVTLVVLYFACIILCRFSLEVSVAGVHGTHG